MDIHSFSNMIAELLDSKMLYLAFLAIEVVLIVLVICLFIKIGNLKKCLRSELGHKVDAGTLQGTIDDAIARNKSNLSSQTANIVKQQNAQKASTRYLDEKQYGDHQGGSQRVAVTQGMATVKTGQNKGKGSLQKIVRYFGSNSGNVFTSIYDQKNDATAFKVTFDDPSMKHGTFELVSYSSIKSADDIDEVIDFENSSMRASATDFDMIKVGEVNREGDSGLWTVTKKIKLKLK